jgi:uncharacterized protein (DUF2252 family)
MKKSEKKSGSNKDQATPSKGRLTFHHVPFDQRYEMGKKMREDCPRESHAVWDAHSKRTDPVDLIMESNKGRIPKLIPLRHGRMSASPFTFYRGAALNMAADLSLTPNTGMYVQACGDAHLSNFGGFATPERNVIFSINDLDETLPAPWEWDLKRLAASFVAACRNNHISDDDSRDIVLNCTKSYRENMIAYSTMNIMDLWHLSLTAEMMIAKIKDPKFLKRSQKRLEKERSHSRAEEIFPQIIKGPDESAIIKDELPAIFHWENQVPGKIIKNVSDVFQHYSDTLPPGFPTLLRRYSLKDLVIKVVGVGSVGTLCWVLLLMTGDGEPLFLQVKEARKSVLEPYAGKSLHANHGQRVVNGHRLMQPYSDPFLGWTESVKGDHYFLRQLRDIKIKIKVEQLVKNEMHMFADWCGEALALSHARSCDAAMLSGYMGKSDKFDVAIADFSYAYADQNEKDYDSFMRAIKSGKLEAEYES